MSWETASLLRACAGNGNYTGGGSWIVNGAAGTDGSYPIVVNTSSPLSPQPVLLGGGGLSGIYESTDRGQNVTDVTPTGPTGINGTVKCMAYASPTGAAYFGDASGNLFDAPGGTNTAFEPLNVPWSGASACANRSGSR